MMNLTSSNLVMMSSIRCPFQLQTDHFDDNLVLLQVGRASKSEMRPILADEGNRDLRSDVRYSHRHPGEQDEGEDQEEDGNEEEAGNEDEVEDEKEDGDEEKMRMEMKKKMRMSLKMKMKMRMEMRKRPKIRTMFKMILPAIAGARDLCDPNVPASACEYRTCKTLHPHAHTNITKYKQTQGC